MDAFEDHLSTGACHFKHETQNRLDTITLFQTGKARAHGLRHIRAQGQLVLRGGAVWSSLSAVLKPLLFLLHSTAAPAKVLEDSQAKHTIGEQ